MKRTLNEGGEIGEPMYLPRRFGFSGGDSGRYNAHAASGDNGAWRWV
jgi:hypothetical protein